jgi:uncharacterized protein (TIGR02217 family)
VSNLVYPAALPGLTWGSLRSPNFNTGVQAALSAKESRIAYQQYPQMTWELQYELLRDYTTPSDLKALVGLFMAVGARYDTFLYSDPAFNTVTAMQFAVADGTTTAYQITATYQNVGGPGGAELIQNFNGTPSVYVNGTLQTPVTNYALGATGIVTFTAGHIPAATALLTWTGSFYYRVRFDTDAMTSTQFLQNFWENKKVQLKQIKL